MYNNTIYKFLTQKVILEISRYVHEKTRGQLPEKNLMQILMHFDYVRGKKMNMTTEEFINEVKSQLKFLSSPEQFHRRLIEYYSEIEVRVNNENEIHMKKMDNFLRYSDDALEKGTFEYKFGKINVDTAPKFNIASVNIFSRDIINVIYAVTSEGERIFKTASSTTEMYIYIPNISTFKDYEKFLEKEEAIKKQRLYDRLLNLFHKMTRKKAMVTAWLLKYLITEDAKMNLLNDAVELFSYQEGKNETVKIINGIEEMKKAFSEYASEKKILEITEAGELTGAVYSCDYVKKITLLNGYEKTEVPGTVQINVDGFMFDAKGYEFDFNKSCVFKLDFIKIIKRSRDGKADYYEIQNITSSMCCIYIPSKEEIKKYEENRIREKIYKTN